MYLRALGARIGKGAVVLSPSVAACPDLLTIGPGTVVRKDAALLCYRAEAGRIQLGRVTLGANVVVGEKTVLDIDTAVGDGGAARALLVAATRPAGPGRRSSWHGSPAQPADVDTGGAAGPLRYGAPVRVLDAAAGEPVPAGSDRRSRPPSSCRSSCRGRRRSSQRARRSLSDPILYAQIAGISLALFYGGMLTALAFVAHRAPARAQAVRAAGPGARALRHPLLGAPVRPRAPPTSSCSTTCSATARSSCTTSGDGLRPVRGAPDRLELRQRAPAGHALPHRGSAPGRWSPTG